MRMEQRLNAIDAPYDASELDDGASQAPVQYLSDPTSSPAYALELKDS